MRRLARVGVAALLATLVVLAVSWLRRGAETPPAVPGATTADDGGDSGAPGREPDLEPPEHPRGEAKIDLFGAEGDESPSDEHGALEGRVLSGAAGGQGIAGAELVFVRDEAVHTTTSGPGGSFRFAAPRPGTYELGAVTAEGYLPFSPQFGHSPVRFSARPAAVVRGVTIFLDPAVDYAAEVTSPDGAPVAGATVQVLTDSPDDLVPPPAPATTDAKGRAVFHAPDEALVVAEHPRWAPARARLDFSAQVSGVLRLRLGQRPAEAAPAASIAGRVLGPDGEPVAGARVEAWPERPSGPGGGATATCDDAGRFELGALDAGRYLVDASAPPYAPALLRGVQSGARDVELRLGAGAVLRGRVVAAADRSPVASFAVAWRRRYESGTLSFFDPAGRFEITGLTPGRYRLTVAAQSFSPGQAEVAVDAANPAEVEVALSPGARVFGRVFDEATGAPLAAARVSGEGDAGEAGATVPIVARTVTAPDGTFELVGLSAGMQSIVAVHGGYHGRIISGLQLGAGSAGGGDVGPVDVGLTRLEQGETASLELTGIGAVLARDDDVLMIGKLIAGGGALEAGLQAGDAILQIGDRAVKDLDLSEAVNLIRGAEGSSLTLTVRRQGGEVVEVQVMRRRIRS